MAGKPQTLSEGQKVVLIMTKHSVTSGWVENEWQSKYWDQVNEKKTYVLPLLKEDCDIPRLLKTRKYADFKERDSIGLAQLTEMINYPNNYGMLNLCKNICWLYVCDDEINHIR